MPRVKVCCMGSVAEVWLSIDAGASAIGLVTAMPSGAGVITDDLAAEIAAAVPPGIDSFLLTSRQHAASIIEQHEHVRTTTIQLVDAVERAELRRLREALPGIRLVQVIHVLDESAIDEAMGIEDLVDAVLLDSGNPFADVKELGGTGRRHDWAVSAMVRERLGIPVFLAGGLNPNNARDVIETVGPYGLDVCSGLRPEGVLDASLLDDFMRAAGVQRGEKT
jgi:phosphoribosylanthranilate isomerase